MVIQICGRSPLLPLVKEGAGGIRVKLSTKGDGESLFREKKFLNWEALLSPVRGHISIENVPSTLPKLCRSAIYECHVVARIDTILILRSYGAC